MSYIPMPVEPFTQSVKTIEVGHVFIHAGETFRYSNPVTLGSGVSQDYMITTPVSGKSMHTILSIDGTAITSFFVYEAGDRTGTTLQTYYNANRNSATTSTATIHKGTSSGTTDGTLLASYASGTATNQSRGSSNVSHDSEWVLKLNTKYIIRITSGTAGNLCNLYLEWYEHTFGT